MIRAIIIDDEKRGRETLENLVSEYCKNVEVVAMANSAKTGQEAIEEHSPDLIFLDIQMPKGTGFDMLESIGDINFEIVFTTAYDKYAIKAIKFAAMDYLLKPVEIDELKAAVDRVEEKLKDKKSGENFNVLINNLKGMHKKIALPTSQGISFIPTDEIIRCEASGNYTCFYLKSTEKILVSKTLKEFDELLSESDFYRVHNSHLVNLDHVEKFVKVGGDSVVMSDGSKIEVSRRRKEGFLSRLS